MFMEKYLNEIFCSLVFAIENDYNLFCTCSLVRDANCFEYIIYIFVVAKHYNDIYDMLMC